jgi:hypothetical protein
VYSYLITLISAVLNIKFIYRLCLRLNERRSCNIEFSFAFNRNASDNKGHLENVSLEPKRTGNWTCVNNKNSSGIIYRQASVTYARLVILASVL